MPKKFHLIIVAVAMLLFLCLSVGSSLTHRPQIDEGMFASPAYNLAEHGHFGTTVLEIEQSPLTRIDQRTYWVMPMFLLNAAASFEAFGFSIFTMRLVSILFGLLLLLAVYTIALKVSGDQITALFALCLTACDYMVLETASSARMDMMSAALGFSAIAFYLFFRERNLLLAVFVSQCVMVYDGLTHPNAITAFAGLLFLTVYLDFGRLTWKIVAAAAIPYLVGGAGFGLWVMQDPGAFKDQFIDNATMGGRMSAMASPFANISREFTERYPHAYGLGESSGGHSGPIFLKAFIMVGYVAGVIGTLLIRELQQNRNMRALLFVTLIYFLIMSFLDGQKQTTYLIHIVPFYVIFLASVLGWLWRQKKVPRMVLACVALGFIALPAGGMLLKIKQNTIGNYYRPMIAYLKENMTKDDVVMAGAELGFGLGFDSNLLADGKFGYSTGKRPRFIVTDSAVDSSWRESKAFSPEYYEYFPKLLNEYRIAYENDAFKVYERR